MGIWDGQQRLTLGPGLNFFITEIPYEVFTYNEQLEENPMQFEETTQAIYPYLVRHLGEGKP